MVMELELGPMEQIILFFLLILFCTDLKTSEKRQAFFFLSKDVHYSGRFCVGVFWMRLTLKWEDSE